MTAIGQAPTLSVSEFVAIFNQSLDMIFPSVGIVGELSNFRISKGAWVYFDLKDDEASVKFFGSVRSLPGPLEDGMTVEVHGRPYLHPKFGFSVQISSITPVGKGTIKKAKDLLASKLKAEGLFDPERKRELQYPPTRIALISSGESAGYSDFIKIIQARWPSLEVTHFDVLVQGVDAPDQIIQAIDNANQHAEADVIVIVRGGGSADDLLAFDDERVVRSVASSRIPTLIGIGHERDVCLAELAADRRASTPSNAAELLVPDRLQEHRMLISTRDQSNQLLNQLFETARGELSRSSVTINDSLGDRLHRLLEQFNSYSKLLLALDPKLLLHRVYVLARDADGQIIKTANTAQKIKSFQLEFPDNLVDVRIQ